MFSRFQSMLAHVGALGLMLIALYGLTRFPLSGQPSLVSIQAEPAAVGAVASSSPASTTVAVVATSTPKQPKKQRTAATSVAEPSKKAQPGHISRLENPYPYPPMSFETINVSARASLVNILCMPRSGSVGAISGSGVIVDPRGVILTNAHVAQYLLLAQSGKVDISCRIRAGAPAVARYEAETLYIPPVWVEAHAKEIRADHILGTGEHDYALLRITRTIDATPLPDAFPFLSVDTRAGIDFPGDPVLAASYPAEFLGGISAQFNLFAASSVTAVKQLLTFASGSPDLISLGGVVEAQGGSSGGPVVNAWGRLIGIIVTTSEGATTGARDLRALSLSYIDSDIAAQTTYSLHEILGGDPALEAADFNMNVAPHLIGLYLPYLTR